VNAVSNSSALPLSVQDLHLDFGKLSVTEAQLAKVLHVIDVLDWDDVEAFSRFTKSSTKSPTGFMKLENDYFVINLSKHFARGSFKSVKDALFYNRAKKSALLVVNSCAHLHRADDEGIAILCAERNRRVLSLLRHVEDRAHFPRTYAVVGRHDADKQSVIQEKFDGDLVELVNRQFKVGHSEVSRSQRIQMCIQLLQQLVVLHENGIVHRDMKPDNVLYKVQRDGEGNILDCRVGIIDFDMAIQEKDIGGDVDLMDGAIHYLPPEVWRAKYQGIDEMDIPTLKARDVWALGAIIYHILEPGSCIPWLRYFDGKGHREIRFMMKELIRGKRVDGMEFLSFLSTFYLPVAFKNRSPLNRILLKMLDPDPSKRPTADDALEEFRHHSAVADLPAPA